MPATEPAGRAERIAMVSAEMYSLSDGFLEVPNDGALLGIGHPASETAALLVAEGLPGDTIRLDIQCLLVRADGRVILFDAGAGSFVPSAGHLLRSLARARVAPSEVTDIFISHAHGDHVGGLVTKSGALAFPAATIHLSVPEWVAFQAEADDDSKRMVAAIRSKVATFEPGARVLDAVTAVASAGHTRGHSSYLIGGRTDKVLYLGDVAHHAVISVQRPRWSLLVDADHAAADAKRSEMLAELATGHARVFVPHFPFPGIGTVINERDHLRWQPER